MRREICESIDFLSFSKDAKNSISDFNRVFLRNEECRAVLKNLVRRYERDFHIDFKSANADIKSVAEKNGLDFRQAHLLLYLYFANVLPSHYEKAGLPQDVCEASLMDLRYKAVECHEVYGVWGTFVADWFCRFFDLTRFKLGRLEFETLDEQDVLSKFCSQTAINSHIASISQTASVSQAATARRLVLNVHIPSSGKLLHEECVSSYKAARDFYRKYFDVVVANCASGKNCAVVANDTIEIDFHCYSWLLFPRLEEFLPPDSNILRFASDWQIYETVSDTHGEDLWRIFGQPVEMGNYADLPEDNTLRKNCKRWLLKGNTLGCGRGKLLPAEN